MCGIAGLIYKQHSGFIGSDMGCMLQAMKHRGPDSTGYALYGEPSDLLVMRFKLADPGDAQDFSYSERLARSVREVEARLASVGAAIDRLDGESAYAFRVTFRYDGELKPLTDYVEDIPGAQVLSLGRSLEIIKDLGDADSVSGQYRLDLFTGTHAIGHVRMATESDVDIAGAHPYWAYPFSDIAVVHNGQLTNYHRWRRRLERQGHRFQSECDSEIIAVYLAQSMADGLPLEAAMKQSLQDLDGVFTYLVVTDSALGMAKDQMAAKPLVLYQGEDLVAMASEEGAIRAVVNREIDTYDPYEGEVMVWSR